MAERCHHSNMKRTVTRAGLRRRSRRKLEVGKDVQTSYFFMLNCLLHSRVHTGLESNAVVYDEDVNVYLAHLLNAQIDPTHIERAAAYVATDDTSVHRLMGDDPDDRLRFMVYKSSADYLLMGVSVFDLFDSRHMNRLSHFRTPREVYVGRAAAYYALAASYATKLERGRSPLGSTLRKIADGIDGYVRILSYMRGQYLGFIHRYTSGEMFHLDRTIEEIHKQETIEVLRNEFLDTYREWMKSGEPDAKERLKERARRLKEIDPAFEFTPPA